MLELLKMNGSSIGSQIRSFVKLNGFQIKTGGVRYLEELFETLDSDAERTEWLNKIVAAVQKLPLKDATLDDTILQTAVNECSQAENEEEQFFNVIDAFSIPKFVYDREKKKYLPYKEQRGAPALHLHGSAKSKANLYRSRYTLVQQKTARHELFAPSVIANVVTVNGMSKKIQLKKVEDLFGAPGKLNEAVLLGMLTQLKADKFFLEDPTGSVELDLSETCFHNGLFTENSIVLAEGWYQESVLHVKAMGFPPTECAKDARTQFGNTNFFGGNSKASVKFSKKLMQLERENPDASIVLISDLWLDVPAVLEKVRCMLEGFRDFLPVCFVMCGSFSSKSYGSKHFSVLRDSFKQLTDVLLEFPELVEKTNFVFVPNLSDPILANILPRPALPNFVTSPVLNRVPNCYFVSNPCRLQYCTQEIVILREDVVEKMCRNCIQMPSEQKDIPSHFAKTILSQGHLCPLPLHVSPVYWDYDHALSLYPLPDLVVVCDKYDAFTEKEKGCIVTNPGSFTRNNFSFQLYYPGSREIQDSHIPD